jgi:uncharacterized protein with HEPN domain
MLPEGRDLAALWDMHQAAEEIRYLIEGLEPQEFFNDLRTRRAVQYAIQVIGEAASRTSEVFRDEHPEIPWKGIIDQRHVIVHHYDGMDFDLLWAVASDRVPSLIEQLDALLPPERPGRFI